MKFKYSAISLLLIVLFTNIVIGKNINKLPSANQLKQFAKSIIIPGTDFKTFSADIYMTLPLPLNLLCQIRYKAPNNYALRVFDLTDNTPFLIVSDKTGIIYNPSTGEITYITPGGAFFELTPAGDQFNANFAINLPVNGIAKNKFHLDFKSMFERLINDMTINNGINSDTIIFQGKTKQNGWARAIFNLNNICKLQQVEVAPEGSDKPLLSFKEMRANLPLKANTFIFPRIQLQKSGLKINKISESGFMNTVAIFNTIMKMMFTRVAIQNPKVRNSIEKMLHIKPNWDQMKILDQKNAKILRDIFLPF